jgi:hypothetical protein
VKELRAFFGVKGRSFVHIGFVYFLAFAGGTDGHL